MLFKNKKEIPAEWGFLNVIAHEIDYIIDVGANEGSYTNRIRDYFGKIDLPSILFEPQAEVINAKNIHPAHLTTVVNMAVGSTCKDTVILHVAENGGNSSSLFNMGSLHSINAPNANFTGDDILINQITLDCALSKFNFSSALLKIDTQGNELEVLKGSEIILKKVLAISVEISFQNLYELAPLAHTILSFLYEKNFVLYGMDPIFKDIKSGAWLQADAYFVRKDIT